MSIIPSIVGETRRSGWMTVEQSMIDCFAAATLDRQFIHIDPVRAAGSPFGGTVAHGFLTLSLLPHLLDQARDLPPAEAKMLVNYGLDRLRFITPVRPDDQIRASFTLTRHDEKRPGCFQQARAVTVEIQGDDNPALTAVWLSQFII